MIKRLIAGAASLALALGGVALATAPAQALTGAACDDGDAWSWSITSNVTPTDIKNSRSIRGFAPYRTR